MLIAFSCIIITITSASVIKNIIFSQAHNNVTVNIIKCIMQLRYIQYYLSFKPSIVYHTPAQCGGSSQGLLDTYRMTNKIKYQVN